MALQKKRLALRPQAAAPLNQPLMTATSGALMMTGQLQLDYICRHCMHGIGFTAGMAVKCAWPSFGPALSSGVTSAHRLNLTLQLQF